MGKCHSRCVFCDLILNKTRQLLFENDTIVIFSDRTPIGRIHLQCAPKEHIKNINSLSSKHIELVETMQREAMNYIMSIDSEVMEHDIKLGFHIPPFTSIGHLHMHCIVPPYKNQCVKCFKTDVIFRPVNAVLRKLRASRSEELQLHNSL